MSTARDIELDTSDQPNPASLRPRPAFQRSTRALLVLVIVLWVAVAAVLVLRLDGRSIDDIFITYRYSQNLTLGNGFVFNPGERVFATTAPGQGLLLAFLHVMTGAPIHALGTATTGFALVLLASILVWECHRRGRTIEGVLGGTWLICCGYLWLFHGSEIPMALALLCVSALTIERFPVVAGLVAGLSVWFRPESLLAVALLGVLIWREKQGPPWRFGTSAATVICVGMAMAWWWFGHPLPSTLAAKQAQAESGFGAWKSGLDFWLAAKNNFGSVYADPVTTPLIVAGLIGSIFMLRLESRVLRLLTVYSIALLLAYPLLGVAYYPWYAIPVVVTILYGVVFLTVGAGRFAGRRLQSDVLRGATIAAVATTLLFPAMAEIVPRSVRLYRHFQVYSWRHELYKDVGDWLRKKTAPDAEIGYVEVGTIAYWSQRAIRDYLALTTPDDFDYVHEGDIVGAVMNHPADYLIRHSRVPLMEPVFHLPWCKENYLMVRRFALPGNKEFVRIYRRVEKPPTPEPKIPAESKQ